MNPVDLLREYRGTIGHWSLDIESDTREFDVALAQVEALVEAIIALEDEVVKEWVGASFVLSDKHWALLDALDPFKPAMGDSSEG